MILQFIAILFIVYLSIRIYIGAHIKRNYEVRVSNWEKTKKYLKKNQIIFLGDSLTELFMIDEYFENCINRGIYGDTCNGVLKRIEQVNELNPKKVFILIGVNDLGMLKSPEYVHKNIKLMIAKIKIKNPHTQIYVQSLYPVNKSFNFKNNLFYTGFRTNKKIIATNKLLQKIEDVTYLNVFEELAKNQQLNMEYTKEGLHLSALGYDKVAQFLKKYTK